MFAWERLSNFSMSDTKSSSSGGTGFAGLLTLVFVTLKLCHVVNWSWWWVLSPVWITAGLVVLILAFAALGYWITRPRTPQEKVAALCAQMAEQIRNRR